MAETSPQKASTLKAMFVGMLFLLSYGVPLNFLGAPLWQAKMVLYACIVILWPFAIKKIFLSSDRNWFYRFVVIFVAYMYIVTIVYNNFTQPSAMFSWIPGLVYIAPLTVFAAYEVFDITPQEIARGIIGMSVLCALFTIIDQFYNLSALDQFVRTSHLDKSVRRVVLAKNEQCFSFVLVLSSIINSRSLNNRFFSVIAFLALSYSLIAVAESRLALAALGIGTVLYILFMLRRSTKYVLAVLMGVGAVGLAPFVIEKYLSNMSSSEDMQKYDLGVRFRLQEIDVFQSFFDKTDGLGFGLMYINQGLNNILSNAMFRFGTMYGAKDYPMGLDDIGFFAALYQFGYIGLFLSIVMTVIMVFCLWKAGRNIQNPYHEIYGAFGCVALAFLFSPLPMNFFTLDWTMTVGGTLWYLASRANRDTMQAMFGDDDIAALTAA